MNKELTKAFHQSKHEPSPHFTEDIWFEIIKRERNKVKYKLWGFASVGLTSLIGLIPAIKILSNDLAQSGFYDYSSLIFSDGISMLSYWKEYILSLAESLPIVSITLTLSLFFVLLLSLKFVIKQIINNDSLITQEKLA
ncbi:MAG: hypothetical protein WCP17_01420 [bacterium]